MRPQAPPRFDGNDRILVTGGAGFIGPHVTTRLLNAGVAVAVMDDFSRGDPRNLAAARQAGLGDIEACDIKSRQAAEYIGAWKPTTVIHLAAQNSFPGAIRSPSRDADINITGTVRIMEAAAAASVGSVVFAASSAIYGKVTAEHLPIEEHAPIAPASPYGLSKAAALAYLEWFSTHHSIRTVALVLGNVYGPGQDANGGVIGRFIDAIGHSSQPVLFGDGSQTRDFVYVEDVADAFLRATWSNTNGLVNIGSGVETSVRDALDLVAETAGIQCSPTQREPIPDEPHRFVLSSARARKLLDWTATTSLADGIKAALAASGVLGVPRR